MVYSHYCHTSPANRKDGTFAVTNLPAGSYLVEVTNPDYFYEPIRVDVTSKGKIRARKVNYMQANAVSQLNYPLRFKPKSPYKYFQIRETWRITDFLFNPMVLMMVLPLLLIMVLPKMINTADPETQRVSIIISYNKLVKFSVKPDLTLDFYNCLPGNAKYTNAEVRHA